MRDKQQSIHKAFHIIFIVLYIILFISTAFYYNSLKIKSVLYIGWILIIIGLILIISAGRMRKKNNPKGDKLLNKGLYGFIRHPEFFGFLLLTLGLIIIGPSFISCGNGLIIISLIWIAINEEEKKNIEKFGIQYKKYMAKVPKLNVLKTFFQHIFR